MNARRAADDVRQRIAALGNAKRAAGAKAYMKSDLNFTGTAVPDLRKIASAWLRDNKDLDRQGLRVIVDELWRRPVFEERQFATILLARRAKLLAATDLPWLEQCIRRCQTWALLDTFVFDAVPAVLDSGALRRKTLTRWAKDKDFWVRRTALLALLRDLRIGDGDWDLWTELAASQLEDQARWAKAAPSPQERFFIRKAIGWVLRERGAKRPRDTVAFVDEHRERMAGLSLREATRNLDRPGT